MLAEWDRPAKGLRAVGKVMEGMEGELGQGSEGRGTDGILWEGHGEVGSNCWKMRYEPAALWGRTKFLLPKVA